MRNLPWIAACSYSLIAASSLAANMSPPETSSSAQAIHIVGSSTVYPFSASAAEQFGEIGEFPTPIIEENGTGGGLNIFCSSIGPDSPDMTNASRPIKADEIEKCAANGIKDITEIKLGYDGIVVSNAKEAKPINLSVRDLFLALAKDVPVKGTLQPNPYRQWSDVNPDLPKRDIEFYGPPNTSGTRDAFEEIVMESACKAFPEYAAAYSDKDKAKAACRAIREDGVFAEQGENDNVIVQKLRANHKAFGIFGFGFLEQNLDKVRGLAIEGAEPTFENIADGSYPIARSLFVYVKNAHVGEVPGMVEFLEELTSPEAIGEEGYLSLDGLIPLPDVLQEQTRERVAALGKAAGRVPEPVTQ